MKKTKNSAIANAKANPITTILGILTMAASLAPVWVPQNYSARVQQSALILAGAGLVAAPDAKKQQQQ